MKGLLKVACGALLTIATSLSVATAPARAELPFCERDARIVASAHYAPDTPEWEELYNLWYDACISNQPPPYTGDVPCTVGLCGTNH